MTNSKNINDYCDYFEGEVSALAAFLSEAAKRISEYNRNFASPSESAKDRPQLKEEEAEPPVDGMAALNDMGRRTLWAKILLMTILDNFAEVRVRAERDGGTCAKKKGEESLTYCVREHIGWTEAKKVSLPFLWVKMRTNPDGIRKKAKEAYADFAQSWWKRREAGSGCVPFDADPTEPQLQNALVDHLKAESAVADKNALDNLWSLITQCTHAELFYEYRCSLVHHHRDAVGNGFFSRDVPYYEPTGFIDLPTPYSFLQDGDGGFVLGKDATKPYTAKTEWMPVYPVAFLGQSAFNFLNSLRALLLKTDFDPFSAFPLGTFRRV